MRRESRIGQILRARDEAELERLVRLNSVAWTCPACGDEVAAIGKTMPEERRCWPCQTGRTKEPSREVRLQVAGVPRDFVMRPFEDRGWPADLRDPLLDVGAWRASVDEPPAVGFLGPAKTGKTMLAVELLWRCRDSHLRPGPPEAGRQARRDPLFVRCDALVSRLFGDRGLDAQHEAYNAVLTAPLAVLDDLGWGGLGRGFQKVLEVTRHRLDHRLPTIWTSNMALEELVGREGGAALMSRLQDGILCGLTDRDVWKTRQTRGRP